jgi:hypothetical protein
LLQFADYALVSGALSAFLFDLVFKELDLVLGQAVFLFGFVEEVDLLVEDLLHFADSSFISHGLSPFVFDLCLKHSNLFLRTLRLVINNPLQPFDRRLISQALPPLLLQLLLNQPNLILMEMTLPRNFLYVLIILPLFLLDRLVQLSEFPLILTLSVLGHADSAVQIGVLLLQHFYLVAGAFLDRHALPSLVLDLG